MKENPSNSISESTRRAIFQEMRQDDFPWWGVSSEVDLLGRVFDLEFLPSHDSRQRNAAGDIRVHRDYCDDWSNDWIFEDDRLNLIHCSDEKLLKLFETIAHPSVQPDVSLVRRFVSLVNRHLPGDGWQLVKGSTISGRPVYQAQPCEPKEFTDSPRYITPEDFDIDLESIIYSVSGVFAYRGRSTEVAILAEATAELKQIGYDNFDGGMYSYALYLRISPALHAQMADECSELATLIRDEIGHQLPQRRDLYEVVIQPFRKAPDGWQDRARAWCNGKGVTNQGRVRSTNIAGREFDGLLFRSQAEINLYEALKRRGVAFAPLPVFLRGGENYQRIEPDFIILKDGIFAVVEVDGDTFHSESPAAARARLKLLEDAGAYVIRINSNSCRTPESSEACADGILRDIFTQKKNRR